MDFGYELSVRYLSTETLRFIERPNVPGWPRTGRPNWTAALIVPGQSLKSYDQEDIHFETIQKSFAHYKNEYQRLLEENSLLQEENQKVRRVFKLNLSAQGCLSVIGQLIQFENLVRQAFDKLKAESAQLQNLMAMVTGEMGTALSYGLKIIFLWPDMTTGYDSYELCDHKKSNSNHISVWLKRRLKKSNGDLFAISTDYFEENFWFQI